MAVALSKIQEELKNDRYLAAFNLNSKYENFQIGKLVALKENSDGQTSSVKGYISEKQGGVILSHPLAPMDDNVSTIYWNVEDLRTL